MNKLVKALISVGALIFGSCLIFVGFFSGKNSADKRQNTSKISAQRDFSALPEEETHLFSSLAEYEEFLSSENDGNRAVKYYYPSSLPSDVTLKSIKVSSEGTIFYFDVQREYDLVPTETNDRDDLNLIELSSTEFALEELLEVVVLKIYTSTQYNFVTDFRGYAEALADDLGASLTYSTSNNDVYKGTIYVSNVMSLNPPAEIGTQQVEWVALHQGESNILYQYTPVSLNEEEASMLSRLEERFVETTMN